MTKLWSEEAKFGRWLDAELAVIKARIGLDQISHEDWKAIANHFSGITINVERILEIEDEVQHDMIADRKVGNGPTAREIIGEEKLQACFDPVSYVRPGVEKIFASP